MSEAVPLGVNLILEQFIRISLLIPETFFYLGGGQWVVGDGPLFLSSIFFILLIFIANVSADQLLAVVSSRGSTGLRGCRKQCTSTKRHFQIVGKNAPLLSQIMRGRGGEHLALNFTFNLHFTISGGVTLSFLRFTISIGYFNNGAFLQMEGQASLPINQEFLLIKTHFCSSRGGSFTKKQLFHWF